MLKVDERDTVAIHVPIYQENGRAREMAMARAGNDMERGRIVSYHTDGS